jgi:hypothetical protein
LTARVASLRGREPGHEVGSGDDHRQRLERALVALPREGDSRTRPVLRFPETLGEGIAGTWAELGETGDRPVADAIVRIL